MYKIDLKEFRRANKMTQQDLAKYLGITQSYVSNMEKGRDTIPDKYIRKITDDPNVDATMVNVEEDKDVVMSRKVFDRLSKLIDVVCSQQGTIAEQQKVVAEQHRTIDRLISGDPISYDSARDKTQSKK